jgi:glycosyltransferase involved in cell wall biosynthesis
LGIVTIEGLACGSSIVVYDLPVYKENIRKCKDAFLVSIRDYQGVADKIISILNMSKDDLHKSSQEARKFSSQFDWDILAERAFKILIE